MKSNSLQRGAAYSLRALIVLAVGLIAWPLGITAAIAAGAATLLIDPSNVTVLGTSYPVISGSTKSQITGLSTHGEEVLYEHEVLMSAAQQNPFADNMTGTLGSGKPVILKNDTTKVAGTQIVIPTVDPFGAPVVQGANTRVGNEEQVKPGDFLLTVGLGWFGAGITNTGKSQTVIGLGWDELTKEGLAQRLAKQQSDDAMQVLKASATSDNTVLPNGKTIDTLGTADTYSNSLIVKSGGVLRDIGARPINARPVNQSPETSMRVNRFLQFTTDANGRPIKTDSAYLQALQFGKERGDTNNLFTGDYTDVDGNIVYPFQTIRHGGYGSIGAPIQPEALLGTALGGIGTASGVLPAGSGILDGGGSATAAAATPLRNYFEFWSGYSYTGINGVAANYTARATTWYGAIVDSTTGKIILFSYTGNTGNTLTGVVVLGSSGTGNYATSLSGFATGSGTTAYNTGNWITTADGAGYLGYNSAGSAASGSKMFEVNSKGVPLAYGYGLGEMALVCGYGRIPLAGGGFKTMANRTSYIAPHGQAFSNGLEVCYGVAAFQRPDAKTPNYTLNVFARKVDGFPVIA